jgi:branched-chain amino acid transport system substrate-binding protein
LVLVATVAACGDDDDDTATPADDTGGDTGAAECGLNDGTEATGEPIVLGGIYGTDQVNDFSSGTDAASAYFDCVNANGGINGRPIQYLVENDEWDPEIAAQVAGKLVNDDEVVALVGNSSFVEMAVNGSLYVDSGIVSVPAACAVRECFESPNMSSTNAGPYPSDLGAVAYGVEELGAENISCIGLNIPTNGVWSCEAVVDYMESQGLDGTFVPLDPATPDCLGALLEATSGDADTVLVTLPAGLAICILAAAEEQDLGDEFNWISPTPLYDKTTPDALGDYWVDKIFIQIELTSQDGDGPDVQNWLRVMDEYGNDDDPRDTFSQGGYLSAKIVTDVLLTLDPDDITRETAADAIRAVKRYDSDLVCAPWYFGPGDVHMSNHSGQIVQLVDGGFEVVKDCFTAPGDFIEEIRAFEEEEGLGESAAENFGG